MLRKHLGSDATPPLLEQCMMVKSSGVSVRDAMEGVFLQQCLSHFLQKERRSANASLSRSPSGTPKLRRRAPPSDKGKKAHRTLKEKTTRLSCRVLQTSDCLCPAKSPVSRWRSVRERPCRRSPASTTPCPLAEARRRKSRNSHLWKGFGFVFLNYFE